MDIHLILVMEANMNEQLLILSLLLSLSLCCYRKKGSSLSISSTLFPKFEDRYGYVQPKLFNTYIHALSNYD
jgi:hypothetical protein